MSVVARLLSMTISIPRFVKLAAGLLLPLAVVSSHAQEWAKARLEASPRHHEYVALKHDNRTVQAFVVYPEVKNKATVVILIHEIFGLTDWAKEMADELAAKGFIVVAPDLLSGFGPNGGGSSEFPSQDATIKARLSGDWAETAAVVKNLDLLVCVDTAVAHCAGRWACRSGWCCRSLPDWRWLLDREDSPWYPTMRLFRQDRPGDWQGVFARIQTALRKKLLESGGVHL